MPEGEESVRERGLAEIGELAGAGDGHESLNAEWFFEDEFKLGEILRWDADFLAGAKKVALLMRVGENLSGENHDLSVSWNQGLGE